MLKNLYLIGLFLMTIAFMSCDTYVPMAYQVSAPPVPLLEEQGDFEVMAAVGGSTFEFQGSVSPLKHVAFMGNVFLDGSNRISHNFGIGSYYKFNDVILLEVYGLTGMANHRENIEKEYTPLFASNNYKNIHISNYNYRYNTLQFNFGFKQNEGETYLFSTRFTRTRNQSFNYTKFEFSDQGSSSWALVDSSEYHFTGSEDMIDVSVGYAFLVGKVTAKVQLTAFKRLKESNTPDIYFRPLLFSATLGWDFNNPRRRQLASKPVVNG